MTDNYILTFPEVKVEEQEGGKADKELQLFFTKNETKTTILDDGTKKTITETKTSTTFQEVSMKLYSINVDKEMYKPGCITAEVLLQQNSTNNVAESKVSTIISSLLNQAVNVNCSSEGTSGESIAIGYRVVNIQPRRRLYGTSLQTILTISMYSPDKYLDMQKYSQCYTGKQLGKEIIAGLLKELKEGPYNIDIKLDRLHQQNMLCQNINDPVDMNEKLEGIHPYLVQYNETPYHFLTRSANRCGEFLFYEGGKLWLGLDTSKSDAMTTTIANNTYKNNVNVMDTAWTAKDTGEKVSKNGVRIIEAANIADIVYNEYQQTDQCGMHSSNYTKSAGSSKITDTKTHVQTYEGPSEEYLAGYDAEKKETYPSVWKKKWASCIYSVLQCDDIVDALSKGGSLEASNAFVWGITKGKTEDKYKEDFANNYTENNELKTKHFGKVKVWNKDTKKEEEKDQIFQFSLAESYNASLTRKLYQWCRERAEVAQKRAIYVKLREEANIILNLGDFVNVFGREYVVTKIHHDRKLSDGTAFETSTVTGTITEAQVQQIVKRALANYDEAVNHWFEAVPALAYKYKQTEEKSTDEDTKKEKTVITKYFKPIYAPALLADNQKRTAAPQRAYVSSTKDPLSLGRIRILYPWQPTKEKEENSTSPDKEDTSKGNNPKNNKQDSSQGTNSQATSQSTTTQEEKKDFNALNDSPFIRMAQPFASAKGGICFMPQKDDEVMIGYEFDDIERPFVIGAVASKDNIGNKVSGNNDVICSPNGHKIQFTNPKNPYGFVTSFVPILGTLQKWGLLKPMDWTEYTKSKELAGGIQLTDKFGIYNLDLSTDKRKITIQSPLGSIQMDAFTGITINCPNGDIAIKGKNITLEAGDKLSLASGKNIDKQKIYYDYEVKTKKHAAWGVLNFFGNTAFDTFGIEDFLKLNFIDMKTTRAVMDAILKPINGTMTIKSGRFMQLEAGKGKTELPNFYEKDSKMYDFHESQSNSVWMRFLTKLDTWYKDYLYIHNNIEDKLRETNELFKNSCPDQKKVKIDTSEKEKADYLQDIKSLYKDVTKDSDDAIKNYESTVLTELGKIQIQGTDNKYSALDGNTIKPIASKITELLAFRLAKTHLFTFFDALMENDKDNDLISTYKTTVTDAFDNSRSYGTTDKEKKRKFFYDIIQKLKKDGKLDYYERKSYSKIFKFSPRTDTSEDVCQSDDLWKNFVGIVSPKRSLLSIYGEYSGWAVLAQGLFSPWGLFHPNVKGGAILMADSNTNGHTVTFNMGDTTKNVMRPAQTIEPVNLKAVADGATTTARNILKNIK